MSKPREFWINCPDDRCGNWMKHNPDPEDPWMLKVIEKSAADELADANKAALDFIEHIQGVARNVEKHDEKGYKLFNLDYIGDLCEEFLKNYRGEK